MSYYTQARSDLLTWKKICLAVFPQSGFETDRLFKGLVEGVKPKVNLSLRHHLASLFPFSFLKNKTVSNVAQAGFELAICLCARTVDMCPDAWFPLFAEAQPALKCDMWLRLQAWATTPGFSFFDFS